MSAQANHHALLNDPIEPLVRRKAGGMLAGILGVMLFTLVDSLFIAMLGTEALAAMSFIMPVTFVVTALSMGMGVGLSAIVSRMLGAKDGLAAKRLVTDSLMLGAVLMTFVSLLGYYSIDGLFGLLGATESTLPYIQSYMHVWFASIILLVLPMMGNAAIRASGNMRTPAIVMITAGLVNAILDPIFIFVLDMGMQGAAIASLVAWIITFAVAFYMLHFKLRLLDWSWPGTKPLLANWAKVLKMGLPASASQMLNPVAQSILVWLISAYGIAGVAAFGVGIRIESTLLIGAMALSAVLPTLFGQNFGAKQYERAAAVVRYSMSLSLKVYALAIVVLWPTAPFIAGWFSDDPMVLELATAYLRIMPLSYAMLSLSMLASSLLTALHRPMMSLFINAIRLFVLTLPAAILGGNIAGVVGIFWAVSIVQIGIGIALYSYINHLLDKHV